MATVAVVLVRGQARVRKDIVDTMKLLRLHRKNTCVLLEDTPALRGMINKVKDFVAWGEISEATFQELIKKRGQLYQGRRTDTKEKYQYKAAAIHGQNYKPYFTLNPPRKGFGRKGIKVAYAAGGALGYRGDKINDLIQRMI